MSQIHTCASGLTAALAALLMLCTPSPASSAQASAEPQVCTAQPARSIDCDAALGIQHAASAVSVTNVVQIDTSRSRKGDRGPPGPPGPPGEQGQSGVVHIVQACASCPTALDQRKDSSALAPLAAALVAGLFGLIGLVISKENKTSEFRQAWIDALRADVADFAASARAFAYFKGAHDAEEASSTRELEYEKLLADIYDKVAHAQIRIRLRVNPADTDADLTTKNDALLTAVGSIRDDLNSNNFDDAKDRLSRLHEDAGPVLKAEWKRVKRGETPYVVAKWSAVILVISAVAALAYFLFFGRGSA